MEAYNTDDKQKGLFTFYREQAEEEDKIKKRRKEHAAKMRQLQMETDGVNAEQIGYKNGMKGGEKYRKQQVEQKKEVQKYAEQKQEQITTDTPNLNPPKQPAKTDPPKKQTKQFQRRLLEILQKHKYERRNIKVALRFGQNQDIALKYHLEALMQQQLQMKKLENKNDRSDLFTPKKPVYSAFQKVALCPTNFEVELDESLQHNKRNIINKKIVSVLAPYPKKLDRVSEDAKPKEDKPSNLSQVLQRNLLPKLNVKPNSLANSNSVCINIQEFYSARDRTSRQQFESVPFYNVSKINSNRDRSLCVESTRYKNDNMIRQNCDKKIFPVFMDNSQSKKCEEEIKMDKEKMYVEIIRKLKFK